MARANLFDEIAAIGRKFVESTDRGHPVLRRYAWQLASICDLIKHSHSVVVQRLDQVDQADSLADATRLVGELGGGGLSAAFRAYGLCDVFVGYGQSLRQIITDYDTTDPQSAPPITHREQQRWMEFCQRLEDREMQVAGMYVAEIGGLQDLAYQAPADLAELKARAQAVKAVLTNEITEFDALAREFRARVGS